MRQPILCLAAVFTLGALVAFGAPASACPTYGPTYAETTQEGDIPISTSCWFNPAPNAMRLYQMRRKTCVTRLYQNITQCNGTVTKQYVAQVSTTYKTCYTPLTTPCVGNMDWQPSPLCSVTSC
jgi:hypothetical protein